MYLEQGQSEGGMGREIDAGVDHIGLCGPPQSEGLGFYPE